MTGWNECKYTDLPNAHTIKKKYWQLFNFQLSMLIVVLEHSKTRSESSRSHISVPEAFEFSLWAGPSGCNLLLLLLFSRCSSRAS